ncbi:probable glutamate receptor [Periplaneta americana]|uniref:probable glutamate receptor n=1 Tax=Periplaneta americana TaxID=6978 RepID=UPI0037E739DA
MDSKQLRLFLSFVGDTEFSKSIWLLFLDSGLLLEEIFTGINIPFDCEFLVARPEEDLFFKLTEVYRVGPTLPLKTFNFGNWTPLHGLIWPWEGFYQRRYSLCGLTLKTALVKDFNTQIIETKDKKPIKISGFFGEIWNMLQEELQFRSDFYTSRDNFFGAPLENGSWTGMIGMLQRGEVDFACSKFLMIPARLQVVDFLSTTVQVKTRLLIKEKRSLELTWGEFLRPFTTRLWCVHFLSLILTGICFSVTYVIGRRQGREIGVNSTLHNIYDAFFYTYASFCQQGQSSTPRTLSCRVVYLTSYLTAVVVMAGYSAFLISFLATRETRRFPFTSFKEFLEDGTYNLEMVANSAFIWYFKHSIDPVMKNIYKKMIEPNQKNYPVTDEEGFQKLCKFPKYAYMTYTDLEESGRLGCEVMKIPHMYIPGSLAITSVKNSPYRGIFNYIIMKMKTNGLLKRLHSKFLPSLFSTWTTPNPVVQFVQVAPVLIFLSVAVLVALAVLFLEYRAQYIWRGLRRAHHYVLHRVSLWHPKSKKPRTHDDV